MKIKNKKKLIALVSAVLALSLCMGMTYAWFTDATAPVEIGAKAARIEIKQSEDGTVTINGQASGSQGYDGNVDYTIFTEAVKRGYLPGEKLSFDISTGIVNNSTRKAVLELSVTNFKACYIDGTPIGENDAHTKAVYEKVAADLTAGLGAAVGELADANGIICQVAENGKIYLALGVPVNDTPIPLGAFSVTIPKELGGALDFDKNQNDDTLIDNSIFPNSYNIKDDVNEQESYFEFEISAKVVQGSTAAVTDVFGLTGGDVFDWCDKF